MDVRDAVKVVICDFWWGGGYLWEICSLLSKRTALGKILDGTVGNNNNSCSKMGGYRRSPSQQST